MLSMSSEKIRDRRAQRQKKGHRGGCPCAYDKEIHRQRNLMERCVLRLKQFRRVATRYDKRASSYLAFVTLAAIMIWLR
jgi:transposase